MFRFPDLQVSMFIINSYVKELEFMNIMLPLCMQKQLQSMEYIVRLVLSI